MRDFVLLLRLYSFQSSIQGFAIVRNVIVVGSDGAAQLRFSTLCLDFRRGISLFTVGLRSDFSLPDILFPSSRLVAFLAE